RLKSVDFRIRFVLQIAREACDGPEVLRMHRSNIESTEAAVGSAGDMEFSTFDLVIPQNLVEKLGKKALCPLFKEGVIARRRRTHDDVATALGLGAPISIQRTIDTLYRLTATWKCKHGRIGPGRIIAVGQNNLI